MSQLLFLQYQRDFNSHTKTVFVNSLDLWMYVKHWKKHWYILKIVSVSWPYFFDKIRVVLSFTDPYGALRKPKFSEPVLSAAKITSHSRHVHSHFAVRMHQNKGRQPFRFHRGMQVGFYSVRRAEGTFRGGRWKTTTFACLYIERYIDGLWGKSPSWAFHYIKNALWNMQLKLPRKA